VNSKLVIPINKNLWVFPVTIFLIVFFKRLLLLKMGLNPEESKDMECIFKILQGQVPYRDFFWHYGYFGLYVNAFLIKLLNLPDVLLPRFLVSIVFALSAVFAFRSASYFLPSSWAFLATLLGFSGLVAREHTYGHIFAFFGVHIALWAGLSFIQHRDNRYLIFAGLASGIALISKPLPLGVLAVLMFIFLIVYLKIFMNETIKRKSWVFILSVLIFPTLGGIYFWMQGALKSYLISSLPMLSGKTAPAKMYFFVPSLFPTGLTDIANLGEAISILNSYLQGNVRWWLVAGMFVGGLLVSLFKLNRDKNDLLGLSLIFLTGFSLVFEIQRILLSGVNPFVNMFPTFVLLIYLGCYLPKAKIIKQGFGLFSVTLLFIYFIYSPAIYFKEYIQKGKPLDLKHGKNIILLPYKWEIYRETAKVIEQNSSVSENIIFAEYDSFPYLFSGRNNLLDGQKGLLNEDWYLFTNTSFHPYQVRRKDPLEIKWALEKEIIKKVQSNPPAFILIPSKFLGPNQVEESPFLNHILKKWKVCKKIGDHSKMTSFDRDYNITIFCKRPLIDV
jgi:hypothetical protein